MTTRAATTAPSDERISVDEALKRGYTHIFCGWNHGEGKHLIAPIRMMRPFLNCGLSVSRLDELRALFSAEEREDQPAGDIPMNRGSK